jgi:hypothetical protein
MTDDMLCGIPHHAVISDVNGGQQHCCMYFVRLAASWVTFFTDGIYNFV